MNSCKEQQDTNMQDDAPSSESPKEDNARQKHRVQPATPQERKIIKECAVVSLILYLSGRI